MTTRVPSEAVDPADVFRRPNRWIEINRSEANRLMHSTPVVVVLASAQSCGGQASRWRSDNPLYSGRAPMETRSLRFYRLDGHAAATQPIARMSLATGPGATTSVASDPITICELKEIEMVCAHTNPQEPSIFGPRSNKPAKKRIGKPNRTLQVTTDRTGDVVTLTAGVKGGCGKHPHWTITDASGEVQEFKGREASLTAKAKMFMKIPAWGLKPNRYQVEVTGCQGPTQRMTVEAFPNTFAELVIERSFAPGGKFFNRTMAEGERDVGRDRAAVERRRALARQLEDAGRGPRDVQAPRAEWDVHIDWAGTEDQTTAVKDSASLNVALLRRVLNTASYIEDMSNAFMEQAFGIMADIKGEMKLLPKVKFTLGVGYVELNGDQRAFVKWRLNADVVLIDARLTVNWDPMATCIPPKVRAYMLDWAARFYIYASISGELTLGGKIGPVSPEQTDGELGAEGVVGVKIGGRLSLMSERVLTADVSAQTSILANVSTVVKRAPEFDYTVKWRGVQLSVVVTTFWSSSPRTHTFELMKDRNLFAGTWAPFEDAQRAVGSGAAA